MFISHYLVSILRFAVFWYLIFLCSILLLLEHFNLTGEWAKLKCLYLSRALILWTCQILLHCLLGKIIFITTVLGTPVSQGSLWQYNSLNILFCLIYDDAGFKDCGAAFVGGWWSRLWWCLNDSFMFSLATIDVFILFSSINSYWPFYIYYFINSYYILYK